MKFSSKNLENAVEVFSKLPGIGRKTALRLVLHLLSRNESFVEHFAKSVSDLKTRVKSCSICHNYSDEEICEICADPYRKKDIVCIVETVRDVMAIEDTEQYSGLYHVLGGVISPIEGVGPEDIAIESALDRIRSGEINEVIMAISPTIEGDTTAYYISRKLQEYPVHITTIARGVSFGGELEYADEITLGRAIAARTPYVRAEHGQ
jgi:recombination protein RecR